MITKEGFWKTFDNSKLWFREWQPDTKPRLAILMVHGQGEHSGRYEPWAKRFVKEGIAFIAVDLRGYGKSQGNRGHSPSYSYFLKDISHIRQNIHNNYKGIPQLVYGHSLGGNIAINYGIKFNCGFDGIIASSPWLKLTNQLSGIERMVVKICATLIPKCKVYNRIDPYSLTRDTSILKELESDKLVFPKLSFKLLNQACEQGIYASTNIYKINCPFLIMHGDADEVTSFKASMDFVQNAGAYTHFAPFKGGHHELHNDIIKEDVFKTVIQWINKNYPVNTT